MNCKRVIVEIDTVNAAFEGYTRHEVTRILHVAADSIMAKSVPPFPLYDYNGNHVGQVRTEPTEV